MSKKKNTLKDLDEFLKQQAASLVSPEKLNVKTESKKPEPAPEALANPAPETVAALPPVDESRPTEPSFRDVFEQLKELAKKNDPQIFREKLYDLLLAVAENHQHIPEDKILINTLLYLKHGQHWKDGIREYWQTHE